MDIHFSSRSLCRIGICLLFSTSLPFVVLAEEAKPEAAVAETPAPEAKSLTPEQQQMVDALTKAVQAYYALNYSGALEHLDEADKVEPGNPQVAMLRGGCYAELGRFDEAQKVYEELVKKDPEEFGANFNLVELQTMQGNYAVAREGFEELLKRFPDRDLLRFKIVLTYLAEQNQEGAIEGLRQLQARGQTPELSYAAAAVAVSQARFTLADRLMIEAEQLHPGRLRHLYDSLAGLNFVLRGNYPPRPMAAPEATPEAPKDAASEVIGG